jgi:hypothetical protein
MSDTGFDDTKEKFVKVELSDARMVKELADLGYDEFKTKVSGYGMVTFRSVRGRLMSEVPADCALTLSKIAGFRVEGYPVAVQDFEGMVDDFVLQAKRDALAQERELAVARTDDSQTQMLRDVIRQQQDSMNTMQAQMASMMAMVAAVAKPAEVEQPVATVVIPPPAIVMTAPTVTATPAMAVTVTSKKPAPRRKS